MSPLSIRAATTDDADALSDVARASVQAITTGQPPDLLQFWADRLSPTRLRQIICDQWVVLADGAGFASLDGDVLGMLYVHPAHQQQGVARRLVYAVATEAARREILVLQVDASMNALDAYARLGFVDAGIQERRADGMTWTEHRMHADVASLLR